MLTKKDGIEQFKRDLRSLTYYKGKRDEMQDKLLELSRIMHEPRANRYDHEIGGKPYNYVGLMEREDALKQELSFYELMIQRIGNMLERIENPEDRNLLIDIYIHKTSYAKLAMQRYMSERNLKYYVDNIIAKIL